MTIRIVTDSACDLPEEVATRHRIGIVPLKISFGDEEFIDREELSTAEFWARSAQSDVLPSTAAPPPGAFEQMYRAMGADGATGILVVSLSSELSATMQSAELAAKAFDDIDIRVVDSRSITLGLGSMALSCARLAEDGATLDEVEAHARDRVVRTRVFGALDTLDNLKKGGRIGNAQAFLATALSIKPIIEVENGAVAAAGRQRTRKKALKFLVDKVAEHKDQMTDLAVLHADCSDIDQFVDQLRPHYDGEIVIGEIGPVIGSHAGRGTIGVAYALADVQ